MLARLLRLFAAQMLSFQLEWALARAICEMGHYLHVYDVLGQKRALAPVRAKSAFPSTADIP